MTAKHDSTINCRAAGWDGIVARAMTEDRSFAQPSPEDIRAMKTFIGEERVENGQSGAFDIVVEGLTPDDNQGKAAELLEPLAETRITGG